jgi:hypothetical protein
MSVHRCSLESNSSNSKHRVLLEDLSSFDLRILMLGVGSSMKINSIGWHEFTRIGLSNC